MPWLDPQSLPRHTDRLFRAAWALCGSRDDAEDLVQETFARVLARPRSLRGQDELAYLMRVLRNTFLTQRRTISRRPQMALATLDDIEPVDTRAAHRPEQATELREVLATIAALSEHHRLALIAVDIVGLSYREAAQALGTREETLAVRLFRARKQMTERLGRDQPAEQAARPQPAGQATISQSASQAAASQPANQAAASQPANQAAGSHSANQAAGSHSASQAAASQPAGQAAASRSANQAGRPNGAGKPRTPTTPSQLRAEPRKGSSTARPESYSVVMRDGH